jgi:hypothetical protein
VQQLSFQVAVLIESVCVIFLRVNLICYLIAKMSFQDEDPNLLEDINED